MFQRSDRDFCKAARYGDTCTITPFTSMDPNQVFCFVFFHNGINDEVALSRV